MSAEVTAESVDIAAADGTADAIFVRPASGGPHPGVLLYMDAYGIRPALEAHAARLAAGGYCVLVPNLFYRHGRSPVLENLEQLMQSEDRSALFAQLGPKIQAVTPEAANADANVWLGFLRDRAEVRDGPIGTVGYCMGGRFSLRLAGEFPEAVAAAASFHGAGMATDQPDSPHLAAVHADRRALHRPRGQRPRDGSGADGPADPGAGRGPRAAHRGAVRGRVARLDPDRRAGLRRGRHRAALVAPAGAVRPRASP